MMFRKAAALCLSLALIMLCVMPCAAAADSGTVVRVGWYETPFNYKDSFGRRTGYAYEYQRKIAAFTGWKYEYVEGSWPELLQMLKDRRIDLMSDISWTAERQDQMLFSNTPMGSEFYYLYVRPDETEISISDVKSLSGKRIGVTRQAVQSTLLRQWLEEKGVRAELVELETTEQQSLQLMRQGQLDAYVSLDVYASPELAIPLWKIGSSDFFFAVSKDRPDLLAELDTALNRIQEENKFYSQQLNEKYLSVPQTAVYLAPEEQAWLADHGPIRVGYQDHYMAFCAKDPRTGELTGALRDYLEVMSGVPANSSPVFEPVAYGTAAEAMEALAAGEIDCMFPANLTDYDGEAAGVVLTAPLMRTEMDAVIRAEDRQEFLRRRQIRVGVNQGNPNYEMFLLDHFPSWVPVRYADTPACLDAVAAKAADCVIISNYRFGDISDQCARLNLTTVYTGVDMDYCLAVREGNTLLYSILSRIIPQVPESTVNAALTYYSAQSSSGFLSVLRTQPLVPVLLGVLVLLSAAVAVLVLRLRKVRKAAAAKQEN